jgi:hypothetical protein
MRPQTQPRTGVERDLVRRKNVPAVKIREFRMCRRKRIAMPSFSARRMLQVA